MITAAAVHPADNVSRLVHRRPVYVAPETPLLVVAEVMAEESIGVVLVSGPHGPFGILSERDLTLALAETDDPADMEARDFMTPEVASVAATTSITDAARLMISNEIRHLTVVAEDRTIGVISIRDVLRVFAEIEGRGPAAA
jgi:CBS domain-containing protein